MAISNFTHLHVSFFISVHIVKINVIISVTLNTWVSLPTLLSFKKPRSIKAKCFLNLPACPVLLQVIFTLYKNGCCACCSDTRNTKRRLILAFFIHTQAKTINHSQIYTIHVYFMFKPLLIYLICVNQTTCSLKIKSDEYRGSNHNTTADTSADRRIKVLLQWIL